MFHDLCKCTACTTLCYCFLESHIRYFLFIQETTPPMPEPTPDPTLLPTPAPTVEECVPVYRTWQMCVLEVGGECQSCANNVLMEIGGRPNLTPNEECEEFSNYYDQSSACCNQCDSVLNAVLSCKECATDAPSPNPQLTPLPTEPPSQQ